MCRLVFPCGFLAFVIAIGSAVWTLLAQSDTGVPAVQIVEFHQSPNQLELKLDCKARNVKIIRLSRVPAQIDAEALHAKAKRMPGEHRSIVVPLVAEPIASEYSIIIFAENQWVELIRQSPGWLERTFNYAKADGWTILGRRTMIIPSDQPRLEPLVFRGKPDLTFIKPAGSSPFLEVRLAQGLLDELWKEPLKQGPVSASYTAFLEEPFHEKLRRLRTGDFAVMCQGMRDMFVHGSEGVPGLRVRAIEAYSCRPKLGNLISFGHSTAEIWIEQLDKWVLFDPWLAIMVVDKDGNPIGAADLHTARDSIAANTFRIVPLAETVHRNFQRGDGSMRHLAFRPASVQLVNFSVNHQLGSAPGFVEYFRDAVHHEHRLQD